MAVLTRAQPEGASARTPRRLFRADSPADVICAALVAESLPTGRSTLAICTDKCRGDLEAFRECMLSLARLYDWDAVIDISGLPINAHSMGTAESASRLSVVHDTLETIAILRGRLDSDPDELYLTCIYHPDVQAMCRAFPDARRLYYPHGFDSLTSYEVVYYEPYLARSRRSVQTVVKDLFRRLMWGVDAVPLRRVELDGAFTFNESLPWVPENHSLPQLTKRDTMHSLFARLNDDVQAYYSGLVESSRDRAGLLMVAAQPGNDEAAQVAGIDAHVHVAAAMVERERLSSLVVKPHPMTSSQWLEEVLAALRTAIPGVDLKLVDRFATYPVELVVAPLSLRAAGSALSSSLKHIRQIYGIPCYCPESRVRELWERAGRAEIVDSWINESRPYYTAV